MSSAEKEISTQTLTCEACGKPFECGAKLGKCWCFEIDLDARQLGKLREDFKNCLCQECLVEPLIRQKSEMIVKEVSEVKNVNTQ